MRGMLMSATIISTCGSELNGGAKPSILLARVHFYSIQCTSKASSRRRHNSPVKAFILSALVF